MGVRQRRCVGCGTHADKASMERFVLVDGLLTHDPAQRHPGRGAYACDRACAQRGFVTGGFQRSFRQAVAVDGDLLHSV